MEPQTTLMLILLLMLIWKSQGEKKEKKEKAIKREKAIEKYDKERKTRDSKDFGNLKSKEGIQDDFKEELEKLVKKYRACLKINEPGDPYARVYIPRIIDSAGRLIQESTDFELDNIKN